MILRLIWSSRITNMFEDVTFMQHKLIESKGEFFKSRDEMNNYRELRKAQGYQALQADADRIQPSRIWELETDEPTNVVSYVGFREGCRVSGEIVTVFFVECPESRKDFLFGCYNEIFDKNSSPEGIQNGTWCTGQVTPGNSRLEFALTDATTNLVALAGFLRDKLNFTDGLIVELVSFAYADQIIGYNQQLRAQNDQLRDQREERYMEQMAAAYAANSSPPRSRCSIM